METIPADLRRNIWIRDEFSCKSCGRTLGWEDLNIGFMGKGDDPDSMITLCSECIRSDNRPIDDPRLARFLGLVRELEGVEEEVETECPSELTSLKQALSQLESDNRFLREDGEKKFRLLVSYKGQFEKAQEDYQNLKKRSEREISSKVNLAMRKVLLGLISSIDDLDRTIENLDGETAKGIIAVRRNMVRSLEETGVTTLEPEGGKFDPTLHEAVDAYARSDVPDGTILKVHSPGYIFEGKVLRPAKVTVSRSAHREAVEFELFEEDAWTEEDPQMSLPMKPPFASLPGKQRRSQGPVVPKSRRLKKPSNR